MPAYRIYSITRDEHIAKPPLVVDCADDQEAIRKAQQAVNGQDVEVWDEGRFIVRVPSADR